MTSPAERRPTSHPILVLTGLFVLCLLARCFEYFVLRTDQGPWGENVYHKLFGIGVLVTAAWTLGYTPRKLGFVSKGVWASLGKGFGLAALCFTVAYAAEFGLATLRYGAATFSWYPSGFSLTPGAVRQEGLVLTLLCLGFNVVNVLMEEGMFRGLFLKLAQEKHRFAAANLTAALAFGLWHVVMPLRALADGQTSLAGMVGMAVAYVVLAGIMALKWGLLSKATGSLWMGMGDHFVNNTITNFLHVGGGASVDEGQVLRIVMAQLLSLALVVAFYLRGKAKVQTPLPMVPANSPDSPTEKA